MTERKPSWVADQATPRPWLPSVAAAKVISPRRGRSASAAGSARARRNVPGGNSPAPAALWPIDRARLLSSQSTGFSSDIGSFPVVLRPEVGDEVLAHPVAQGVLQFGGRDEQVVLRVQPRRHLRALEVEREPLLDPLLSGPGRKVHEQG